MDLMHPPIYIDPRKPLDQILTEVAQAAYPDAQPFTGTIQKEGFEYYPAPDFTLAIISLAEVPSPYGEWGISLRVGTSFGYIHLGDEFTRYVGHGSGITADVYPDGTTKILRFGKPPSHLVCSLFNTLVVRRSENTYSFADLEAPNAFLRTCSPSEGCSLREYEEKIDALGFIRVVHESDGVIWI